MKTCILCGKERKCIDVNLDCLVFDVCEECLISLAVFMIKFDNKAIRGAMINEIEERGVTNGTAKKEKT